MQEEPADRDDNVGSLPDSAKLRLLRKGTAEDVYSAISQGDPLELQRLGALRLKQLAYLLDADRLHRRALLRVAHKAPEYDGEDPKLDDWIQRRLDEAAFDLLNEDSQILEQGYEPPEEFDERYYFMSLTLLIHPEDAVQACVNFNGLPDRIRNAFFALCIEGRTVRECLDDGHGPAAVLRRRCHIAFRAVFLMDFEIDDLSYMDIKEEEWDEDH